MQGNAAQSYDSFRGVDGESILNLFFQFNRRLLALLDHFQSPLTTNESHCISELIGADRVISRDLTDKLNCDKSTISRTVAHLKKSRIVTHVKSPDDKREKILAITPKGKDLLSIDVQCRNREVLSCTYTLNELERAQFTSYLELIADTLRAPRPVPVEAMEPFLSVIRRLTRAMGILGSSVFGTGYPVNLAQVLWLTSKTGGILAVSDLAFSLPYLTSEVSQLLTKLIGQGFLIRKANPADKRRIFICLTKKGAAAVKEIRTNGSAYFEDLLSEWQTDDIEQFRYLLEKSLACPLPSELLPQRKLWRVVTLNTDMDRTRARTFLLEEMIRLNIHHLASHTIISPQNRIIAIEDQGAIIAVTEIGRETSADTPIKIINFASSSSLPQRIILSEMIWQSLSASSPDSTVRFSQVAEAQLAVESISVHDLQILLNR